MKLLINKIYWL